MIEHCVREYAYDSEKPVFDWMAERAAPGHTAWSLLNTITVGVQLANLIKQHHEFDKQVVQTDWNLLRNRKWKVLRLGYYGGVLIEQSPVLHPWAMQIRRYCK